MTLRVAIVGAGLQGRRRAEALAPSEGSRLSIAADINVQAARALAAAMQCDAADRWEDVVERADVDAVVISTPPHMHVPIALAAMQAGKHVLCEKPLARTAAEAAQMVRVARRQRVVLKCGFNLRHHAAILQVRRWVDEGRLGDLFLVRARYGTGGRPGYEKEWRARADMSGGGQLMDQGVHLLDLCRWFLGDFVQVSGMTATYFWDVAPLEDNVFALLRAEGGQVAALHASWTEWKPLFCFEVVGRDGYAAVDGLGGAYGVARAVLGRRLPTAPFEEESIEFRRADTSWRDEWNEFVSAIRDGREPAGGGTDGVEAIRLAEAIYAAGRAGTIVAVERQAAPMS